MEGRGRPGHGIVGGEHVRDTSNFMTDLIDYRAPEVSEPPVARVWREKLAIAQTLREYHHKALWEEEKHFTWLNSLVLSAQVLLFTADPAKVPIADRRIALVIVGLFGMLLSSLGLTVIRRESYNFHVALLRFIYFHNAVFPESPLPRPARDANRTLGELLMLGCTGRLSIKDAFQTILLAFMAMFAATNLVFILLYP